MTQTEERKEYRAAISRYHAGQTVYPCVTVENLGRGYRGRDKVRVVLTWHDSADKRNTPEATFTGQVEDAEKWLGEQGVRLDAQGIH